MTLLLPTQPIVYPSEQLMLIAEGARRDQKPGHLIWGVRSDRQQASE